MPRLTDQQLAARKHGIGASDVAALCDLDEHRTPFDVWVEKVADLPRVESIEMFTGHAIEPYIAAIYEERVDAKLEQIDTLVHAKHPWAFASPDRRATRGPVPLVEIKNVGAWNTFGWGAPPTTVPASKMIQVQWQMEVADEEADDIAALIGGTDFRRYTFIRDRELGGLLLEIAERFMRDHVLTRIPPPHTGEEAQRVVSMRYPRNDGTVLPTSKEAFDLVLKLKRARRAEQRIADLRANLEARAKDMIGSADAVDGCFRWKRDARGRVAWEAVARELNPTQEIIDKHTSAPVRRFSLIERRSKRNGDDHE